MNPTNQKTYRWPDLSDYGITFGILDMPDGSRRLVMVDPEGAWSNLASEIGFSPSRWVGLYVMLQADEQGRPSMRLHIPSIKTRFPRVRELQLTVDQLRTQVRDLVLERRHYRISQTKPQEGRLSWKPHTEIAAAQEPSVADVALASETVGNALKQTIKIGPNSAGEDVYEAGDGRRYLRLEDGTELHEESAPSTRFLRVRTDLDLIDAASGMVRMAEKGLRLGSEDFVRYAQAIGGAEATEDRDFIGRLQLAVDAAIERSARRHAAPQDAFRAAQKLHSGRAPFWRPEAHPVAPLPLVMAMDNIAAHAKSAFGEAAKVLSTGRRQTGDLRNDRDALQPSSAARTAHDIHVDYKIHDLAGTAAAPTQSADAILNALGARSAQGISVFWIQSKMPGRIEPASRRLLSSIGQRYELAGIIDLDASLLGAGSAQPTRLIVVGHQRDVIDSAYAIPATAPQAFDFTDVWEFSETVGAKLNGQDLPELKADEDNVWQVPYIPTSQVSEPETMIPRNLLAPVKQALQRLEERHQMTVDEFVSSKLKWTMAELGQRLSAEQIDGVALSIDALDRNEGFVTADGAGIGKGREGAATALYASRLGKPVIFLTGSAELFGTFYRDVKAIGALEELGRPFIVNSNQVIKDEETGQEVARSIGREEHHRVLSCGEFPFERKIAIATYSQFSRQYDRTKAVPATAICRMIREMLTTDIAEFAAIKKIAVHLDLPDYQALGLTTAEQAAAYELRMAETKEGSAMIDAAEAHRSNARLLQMDRKHLLDALSEHAKVDSTTLKHQWLYSGALHGAVVIGDESHYAAGETSQTGVNLRYLVENASAVMYSSATFAKDVQNFGLYSRLFPETVRIGSMTATLKRGGEAMQEILSSMLAQDGKLIRREHDLSTLEALTTVDSQHAERNREWAIQFSIVLAGLSYLSGEISDMVMRRNEGYQEEHAKLHAAALAAKSSGTKLQIPALGVHYTHFASKFNNIARIFLMSMKADYVADLAVSYLRNGQKPLIAVENTLDSALYELVNGVELDLDEVSPEARMEGSSPRAASDQAGLDLGGPGQSAADGVYRLNRRVGFKDLVLAYVDGMFEARLRTREGAKIIKSERISLMTPALELIRNEIRATLERMPEVPLSPLDLVRDRIAAAGFTVGEISGRKWQLTTLADGNHAVVRYPARDKQAQARAFNNGQLDALIASKSGYTGISLHASRDFADQRQRVTIELQSPRSISDSVQLVGRTNRRGQVNHSIYHRVSTGLPAEMRELALKNRALRRLSANVSGNADNRSIDTDVPEILNAVGNEVAFRWLESNPQAASILGYKIGELPEDKVDFNNTRFVDLVTSHLFYLHPDVAAKAIAEMDAEFRALMEQHRLDGTNPLKAAEHDFGAETTGTIVLHPESGRASAFDGPVMANEITYKIDLPAIDRDTLTSQAELGRQELIGQLGDDFNLVVSTQIKEAAQAALPALLPKRFSSIEAALADSSKNTVKNAVAKFDWLAKEMRALVPGSIICYRDTDAGKLRNSTAFDDLETEAIFITAWKLPKDNLLSLAEYRLCGVSSRTRAPVELSMSAWYSRQTKWHGDLYYKQHPYISYAAKRFFEAMAKPLKTNVSRVVLQGNIYRAAELAETQRTGTTITYSDSKGRWHHGVILPKAYTLRNVAALPVPVTNAEMLIAALASRTSDTTPLLVTDDERNDAQSKRTYSVCGRPGALEVYTFGERKSSWLQHNAAVKACLLGGEISVSRTQGHARVRPEMEQDFLRAFFSAADETGIRINLPGHMRDWYTNHIAAQGEATLSQRAIDAVLANDDDNEISRLLASAP